MLHQVLNIACPNHGTSYQELKNLSGKIIKVYKNHDVQINQGNLVEKEKNAYNNANGGGGDDSDKFSYYLSNEINVTNKKTDDKK